jgi:tetratricopeptide (TPR) repeat protein
MDQIDSPLSGLFKQQFTEYQVQAGDTLSKIAKQAYDDPFLFYALARFNGIENPSRVAVGQVLRVPELQAGGTANIESQERPAPSKPPPATDRTPPEVSSDPPGGRYQDQVVVTLEAEDDRDPAPRIRYTLDDSDPARGGQSYTAPLRIDRTSTLRFLAEDGSGNPSSVRSERYEIVVQGKHRDVEDLRDRGEYAAALDRLERILAEDPGDTEAQSLFVDIAVIRADALQAQGDLLGAQGLLQRASQLQPDDRQVQERLVEVERRVGIDQMLQNATDAMQQGDYETAYTALNQVLELEPTHAVARGKRVVVRSELVDQYGKRAVAAFRRQDLDESIRQWDKVLELDPENEEAQLRRQEAVHLKEVFEKKFN